MYRGFSSVGDSHNDSVARARMDFANVFINAKDSQPIHGTSS